MKVIMYEICGSLAYIPVSNENFPTSFKSLVLHINMYIKTFELNLD